MRTGSVPSTSTHSIHAWGLRTVAPERRHDLWAAQFFGKIAPEEGFRVLMAVEYDDLGAAEVIAAGDVWDNFAAKAGV